MAKTEIGEHAIVIPASTTRPSASGGMIRYNSTTNDYEEYSALTGGNRWHGIGGRTLVARYANSAAWNVWDITFGSVGQHSFAEYEIHWIFSDPVTSTARHYAQFFDAGGTLFQNSGANGYSYCDAWVTTNDGWDAAGTNFSIHTSNCSSYIPISNHNPADSGYWSTANGETQVTGMMYVGCVPSSMGLNHFSFYGKYQHHTPSAGMCGAEFGGMVFSLPSSRAVGNGTAWYGPSGIRFGLLDGYQNRAGNGTGSFTALCTVYGVNGTELGEL